MSGGRAEEGWVRSLPLCPAWGLQLPLSSQRPGFEQCSLDYAVQRGVAEPWRWGANFIDIYPSNKEAHYGDAEDYRHKVWARYGFREHPDDDQRYRWNIDTFRELHRTCHRRGFLVGWFLHHKFTYDTRDEWWRIVASVHEELGSALCYVMEDGWEIARVSFPWGIASATVGDQPWPYFDGNHLFLPNRRGIYRISVKKGGAVSPHIASSFAVVERTAWQDGVLSFRAGLCDWVEGMPEGARFRAGIRLEGWKIQKILNAEIERHRDGSWAVVAFSPGEVGIICTRGSVDERKGRHSFLNRIEKQQPTRRRTMAVRNWGEPAPKWLREAETYGEAVRDWGLISRSNWSFVTHVPHSKEYIGQLPEMGIRAFPYMSFYQAPIHHRWQGIRISEHPDWIEIGEGGEWKRTGFWESEDSKNWYCTCTNMKAFTDSVLEYLDALMEMGAGGIFLDNLHPNKECYGPRHKAHEHMFSTQIEAFADLMRRAKERIKRHDPEGALLVNSADPPTLPSAFWPHVDAEMSESFICTWVADQRWGDWHKDWNSLDKRLPGLLEAGKQICCLSYLGHTPHSIKEDAFFCYASAKLMGFIWTARGDVLSGDEAEVLYRIRLGAPAGTEETQGGVHYRRFQYGMVAVNPTDQGQVLEIASPLGMVYDLYLKREIRCKGSRLRVGLPPQAGRVYLWEPEALGIHEETPHLLTLKTHPELGKVRFRVDGTLLWTHAGRWTTEYVKGPQYGQATIDFDAPGEHTVELMDAQVGEMLVAESYEQAYRVVETDMPGSPTSEGADRLRPSEERVGKLMDPSNPTQFLPTGKVYRFTGWSGATCGSDTTLRVRVDDHTELVAHFALENK